MESKMSTRYEEATSVVWDMIENVKISNFPELDGANLLIVMDNKKKVASGRIVVARIKKMNDELKFFAMADDGTVYDYVMFIDKVIFDVLSERDKERIIFHELCHCEVNHEKTSSYNIKDHEIQGFYDESDFNLDDPRWSERIGAIVDSVYDPDNDGEEHIVVSEGEINEE